MTIIYGLIRIAATVIFLYLIWRRLKEDYNQDDLLSYSWLALLVYLAVGRLSYGLVNWGIWNENLGDWLAVWSHPGFDYVGAYFGLLVLSYVFANTRSWKIWNFAEDMTQIFLIYIFLAMTAELVFSSFGLSAIVWWLITVLVLVLSNLVKDKYRSFVWYVSGKKGFVFLFANILFAIFATGVSFWLIEQWYLRILFISWGLISVVGLVMLGDVIDILKIKRR